MKAEYIIISIVVILIIINYYKTSNAIQNQIPSPTPVKNIPPSPTPVINIAPSIPSVINNIVPSIPPSPTPVINIAPSPTPVINIPPSPTPVINIPPSITPSSINQFWTPLAAPSYTPDTPFTLPYDIPDIEIYDDSDYPSIIMTKNADTVTKMISNVKVFCGGNIVIVIDKDNIGTDLQYTLPNGSIINPIIDLQSGNKSIYYYAIAMVIDNLNKLTNQFVLTVNVEPTPRPYRNKPIRIEIAYLMSTYRGSAGGLASHGLSGAAIGPAFLAYFLNSCISTLKNNNVLLKFEQIFTYELCRNYLFRTTIYPILNYNVYSYLDRNDPNKKFIYSNDYTTCPTQGFVNILGGILTLNIKPTVSYNYSGFDLPRMFKMFEDHLDIYINGTYTWDDAFLCNRLIWNTNESLDNLYSALIIRLWKTYNTNGDFLIRFFSAIKLMIPMRHPQFFQNTPQNIANYTDGVMNTDPNNLRLNLRTAAENFYIAASYGAKQDIYTYFTVTLRRSIRPEAQTFALNLIKNNP